MSKFQMQIVAHFSVVNMEDAQYPLTNIGTHTKYLHIVIAKHHK